MLAILVIMSKQSNLGSAPPSPIDIDTPDGSIFGADLRDNETHVKPTNSGLCTLTHSLPFM